MQVAFKVRVNANETSTLTCHLRQAKQTTRVKLQMIHVSFSPQYKNISGTKLGSSEPATHRHNVCFSPVFRFHVYRMLP